MDNLIQRLVDRFLAWRLPKDFHPDAGITFTPPDNEAWWPVGTNLFTADQARQMFEEIVKPELESQQARIRTLEEALRGATDLIERWMQQPGGVAGIRDSIVLEAASKRFLEAAKALSQE